MNPDELQNLLEETIFNLIKEKGITESEFEKIGNKLTEIIPEFSDDVASILYKTLRKKANSMLNDRRCYLKAFEKRHYILWRKGINLLESFLVVTFELGENFNKYYRSIASENQIFVFDALTRLHARALHIGFEILCLLRSGFADGAHARWRTVHEIAVVSNFLAQNNNDVSLRYIEHEVVESYRAMQQYQEYASQLHQEVFTNEDVAVLKTSYDKLCAKYGKPFGTQYGWAAEVIKKDKPTFADIEKASGLDYLRPYYKMASHNVHANPKGIKFRLGLSDGVDILLAGPSNYGLTEPAHGLSISVLHSTIPMLNMVTNIDSIVMEKILNKYVDDIGMAFIETDQSMQEYNNAQQKNK